MDQRESYLGIKSDYVRPNLIWSFFTMYLNSQTDLFYIAAEILFYFVLLLRLFLYCQVHTHLFKDDKSFSSYLVSFF